MALPLPPTPVDTERPYLPELRKVRRNRSDLRERYRTELDSLERNRTVRLVDGVDDRDLGWLGRLIRWKHLQTKNSIRAAGVSNSDLHEYDIPASRVDDVRRPIRRVVWLLRLTNVVSVVVQLLCLVTAAVAIMFLLGLFHGS
jgi:hypothetical protein